MIVNQARALGYTAWLMAQTPLKNQPWKCAPAEIKGLPADASSQAHDSATLTAQGIDLSSARIVWEMNNQEPFLGEKLSLAQRKGGLQWVEAEAQLPDGRRVFATWEAAKSNQATRN